MADSLRDAFTGLEQALAEALETVTALGTTKDIEKLVGLLTQKRIVTGMLLEKIDILTADGNEPSSNQLGLWDQLMYPKNFFL
jgi:hypothetical protein